MDLQLDAGYKRLITELVNRFTIILGPDITSAKIRKISGLKMQADGRISVPERGAQQALFSLVSELSQLSEFILKRTLKQITTENPDLANFMPLQSDGLANGSTDPNQYNQDFQHAVENSLNQDITRAPVNSVSNNFTTGTREETEGESNTVPDTNEGLDQHKVGEIEDIFNSVRQGN